MRPPVTLLHCAVILAAALGVAACDRDTIVYRDREPFNPPKDSVNGFLGYFSVADKTPSCGNCHVGHLAQWRTTKHAEAWSALTTTNNASNANCVGCHSVNQRGNALTVAAGYSLVQDSAYHDVQCESCHGPGFTHVQDPDITSNQPLAPATVGANFQSGCGECHSGAHNPFVEQWSQSAHGATPAWTASSSTKTSATCMPCHEGKTAMVVKFGENENYIEKNDGNPMPINCVVCHNPHGSPNDHQLRASIRTPTREHLCVTCHSRTGTPTPPSNRGPHGAQGLMVIGENVGYIPAGFDYDTTKIVGSHGTSANPKLCATCHVAQTDVTDPATGSFVFHAVGHTFEAIPCLDANGIPTAGPCALAQRDFRACATSGCHGDPAVARSAYQVVGNRINNLLDQLWTDTDADSVIDAYPTDGGLLPKIVALGVLADFDPTDQVLTAAEGALWNGQLAFTADRPQWGSGVVNGKTFSSHVTSGHGVHNPFLIEALLLASIAELEDKYNITPSPRLDTRIHAIQPPGVKRIDRIASVAPR